MLSIRSGNVSRLRLALILLSMEHGAHFGMRGVEFIECSAYRLEPTTPGSFNVLDGEVVESGPIQCSVMPSSIRAFCNPQHSSSTNIWLRWRKLVGADVEILRALYFINNVTSCTVVLSKCLLLWLMTKWTDFSNYCTLQYIVLRCILCIVLQVFSSSIATRLQMIPVFENTTDFFDECHLCLQIPAFTHML